MRLHLLFLLLLSLVTLSGCVDMKALEGANAMKNGTQAEFIKKAGGVSAFNKLPADELSMLCSMYTTSGKINTSIQCHEVFIERFKDSSDAETHYFVINAYEVLAILNNSLGHYKETNTAINNGLALYRQKQLSEHIWYGELIKQVEMELYAYKAVVARNLGDKKEENAALVSVEQRIPWLNEQEVWIRNRTRKVLAQVHLVLGNYERAADYAKVVSRKQTTGDKIMDTMDAITNVLDGIFTLGIDTYLDAKNEERQEKVIEESKLAFDTSIYYFARADLEAKRYNEALAHFKELEEYTSISKDFNLHWMYWYDYARTYLGLEDNEQAIAMLKKSIAVIESQRTDFNSEMGKLGFARGKQQPYELMIQLQLEMGNAEEAFTYVERAKARSLVDLLAGREDVSLSKTQEETQYLTQLQRLELKIPDPGLEKTEEGESKRGLIRVKQGQIKDRYPELASLVSVDTLTSLEVDRLLNKKEVLIEYYIAGDSLYAFVLENGKLKAYPLKDGKKLVDNIRRYRESLTSAKSRWKRPSMTLYKQLIKPFERQVRNKKLVIVPHGAMHYLPFASLYDGNAFLIDKAQVRLMPSASVLQYLGQHQQATDSMMILGNPDLNNTDMDLPGAEREAKVIAKLWKDTDVKLRAQATETALKNSTSNYGMFHFASHGVFEPQNPLDSGLLLASDSENDGRLTVAEIYGIKINADLVTLSACETGLGDIVNGDDVVGLNRGFLYAGADSILSSLWSVEDKPTAYFMQSFYRYLKTNDKARALQLAQIKTRKKYSHPYRWASFQLIGATD